MTPEPTLTRRSALRATTAATGAACALALAGCTPAGNAASGNGEVPSEIPTGGTRYQVGKLSELPVGTTAAGTANGVEVVLFRADETTILAYTDVCTHAGCKVAPQGEDFKCPCHGSVFKGSDGTVVSGPAKEALPRYAAAIDGEWITVSL
ncbi:Ferredoxin subunit of nitrite reductase or a ring-hydroxylating dioxygenase [Arthrobacter alpinus]|uniref:Cytochrome bc1 complex Rieske iron-sulfur subunit n=1 Tax=Arthrobacter alpinus TaxID=656366 RepID=A0A1H5H7H9_9MICC|nr:Rieske (2Fe-2S) protein [Arthrobacter alpinus]SEE23825.1 Ferredoxin subunit of nitrite reductase or a ring-hydroxylating dioxygenase [Arthrobacter alpinus]